MKSNNYRIILSIAAAALVASGALLSSTTGLSQIKIIKDSPAASPTPVKIGAGGGGGGDGSNGRPAQTVESKIVSLTNRMDALKKENADLQTQIGDLKRRVEYVDTNAIQLQPPSIQMQINTLNKKLAGHTHGLTFDAMNLQSLGCKTCAFQPLVMTYNKSHDQTGAPVFK